MLTRTRAKSRHGLHITQDRIQETGTSGQSDGTNRNCEACKTHGNPQMWNVNRDEPFGAFLSLGSCENEYCVLAMQTRQVKS
jgi:hypothetical protein